MSEHVTLPRVLVIDDLLGRNVSGGRNEERIGLCGQLLLRDVTGDSRALTVDDPVAEAVFFRGQRPVRSSSGDTVENDLDGIVEVVRRGYDVADDHVRWALVLLDLCFYTGPVTVDSDARAAGMPEGRPDEDVPSGYFGLTILERLHSDFPHLPIVILSAQDRVSVSHQFADKGALGFLARGTGKSAEMFRAMLWRHGLFADPDGSIVGHSRSLLLALRAARRAAAPQVGPSARHVLLRGERGTGKELLARFLNLVSAGAETRCLVDIDCGTLQGELWADALFGRRRGAFTGADSDREGRLEQADGGDLFLDEIGNMPPVVQAGLLRVIETGRVTRLGGTSAKSVNVRVLSATNSDIELKAGTGGFRSDLLDRLREAGTIFLPPLRDRLEDVPVLVEQFVRAGEAATAGALPRRIDPRVFDLVRNLEWPDNLRGLKNCVTQAVRLHPDLEHLVPDHILAARVAQVGGGSTVGESSPASELTPPREPVLNKRGPVRLQDGEDPFRDATSGELAGALPGIEQAHARRAAMYLRRVLALTRKVTRSHPDGEVSIHRAMKFATGNDKLSASKAADLIKRALAPLSTDHEGVMADPLLREALETANRLRPKKAKAPQSTSSNERA
jgi:DNA-binding NtrC family response regulator